MLDIFLKSVHTSAHQTPKGTRKDLLAHFFPLSTNGWIGGWLDWGMGEVRGGIDSRVDSQTVSAGSGLMDNVPPVHSLLPPTHDCYSSEGRSSFSSHELTKTTVSALCGTPTPQCPEGHFLFCK